MVWDVMSLVPPEDAPSAAEGVSDHHPLRQPQASVGGMNWRGNIPWKWISHVFFLILWFHWVSVCSFDNFFSFLAFFLSFFLLFSFLLVQTVNTLRYQYSGGCKCGSCFCGSCRVQVIWKLWKGPISREKMGPSVFRYMQSLAQTATWLRLRLDMRDVWSTRTYRVVTPKTSSRQAYAACAYNMFM